MASAQPFGPHSARFRIYAALSAVLVTIAVAVADVLSPNQFTLPIVYIVPLLMSGWSRHRAFLWGLASVMVVLTFAFHFWGLQPAHLPTSTASLINRGLSVAVILLIAGLLQVSITSEESREQQRELLEKQYAELEAVNQELGQREEEIVRQNEELQSQTEELERQSEELRMTNEELATREKALENLLDLSRSLTAELDRDEVLKRICEALGLLANGTASAMWEVRGSQLALLCHHGFEPGERTIPYEHSFGALILFRGQTGYLEDLNLRPDLRTAQPADGEPFRSLLSAPLRVHNRLVGTIELYSYQAKSWSDAEIAVIESLAAQASISLQSAALVEAIRRERKRFESAFRTVPFGMAVAEDPDGRHVRFNPAAAAMFNVALDENVALSSPTGLRLKRYFFKNDRVVADNEHPLERALHGEEVYNEELEVALPSGKRYWLLASAVPTYGADGNITGAVCGFADVLPLKTLQRELEMRRREAEEANVRKTRFLAAVSHDIRTPANAINLMAEVIGRMAGSPALAGQIPEMSQKLRANALTLVALVGEVLDLARFDSGKVDLQETEFGLHELIQQEVHQLLPLAQQKGLQLIADRPAQLIWLRTDRVKLARVLGNLIGNAIKFTEHGRIDISTSLTIDGQVEIQVRDTGVGISPDQISRIFDEFAQLRNPERDSSKGTGLGLAICRRLVEVIGGQITVESKIGQGSTFTIILPATCRVSRVHAPPDDSGSALRGKAGAERASLRGLCVLLVEDHATTREGVARILRDDGAEVYEAATGSEALAELAKANCDVLLLDMMLPDMDGRDILAKLQQERPARLRAVIVMTGDLTEQRRQEIHAFGADTLLAKPIDLQQLMTALRSVRKELPS